MKRVLQFIGDTNVLPQDEEFPSRMANQIFYANVMDFFLPILLIAVSFVVFALIKGTKKYQKRKLLPWLMLAGGFVGAILIWIFL